jgi:hypothetical protein
MSMAESQPGWTTLFQLDNDSPRRWDHALLGLLALPWLLLVLDSSWLFTPIVGIDPWIYFGYYHNLPDYIKTFDGLYYTTRLSVTIPGWLSYRLLPPLAANAVLHLGLYYLAVVSLYLILKTTVNRRAAFLGAAVMGCHYMFLWAVGWDYTDGYGIAYLLLSMFLMTRAAQSVRRRWYLAAAGAAVMAVLTANLLYLVLVPFLALSFLAIDLRKWYEFRSDHAFGPRSIAHIRWTALRRTFGWLALGSVCLLLVLGLFNWSCGGRFWFMLPSVTFAWRFTGQLEKANIWRLPVHEWLPKAFWLLLPALSALMALIYLAVKRWTPGRVAGGMAAFYQWQLLLLVATFTAMQVGGFNQLQIPFATSMLLPAAFLALGTQLGALSARLTHRQFLFFGAIATLISLAAFPIGDLGGRQLTAAAGIVFLIVMTLAAGAVWLRRIPSSGRLAVLVLIIVSGCNLLAWTIGDWPALNMPGAMWRDHAIKISPQQNFKMMEKSISAIRVHEPTGNVWFWYDQRDGMGSIYSQCASTHLYMYRLINSDFPQLPEVPWSLGSTLQEGVKIAILSKEPDALARAGRTLLAQYGLSARLLGQQPIGKMPFQFTLTLIQTMIPPGSETPLAMNFKSDEGSGRLIPKLKPNVTCNCLRNPGTPSTVVPDSQ